MELLEEINENDTGANPFASSTTHKVILETMGEEKSDDLISVP